VEVLVDQLEWEDIISSRHRSVRREYGIRLHSTHRVGEWLAASHLFSNSLQHHEPSVALVCMPHRGYDAKSPHHPHAANTQQYLLLYPLLSIGGVQSRRKLAVGREFMSTLLSSR